MATIQSVTSKLGDVLLELDDLISEDWKVYGGLLYDRLAEAQDSVAEAHHIMRHAILFLRSKLMEELHE